MGNFASIVIRNSVVTKSATFPSDAFIIDCDWLEATHPHFQLERLNEQKQCEPAASSTPLFQCMTAAPSWMRSVINCCHKTLRALVSKPDAPAVAPAIAAIATDEHNNNNNNGDDGEASDSIADDFFDEFHQVFEPRMTLSKAAPTLPALTTTVVKTLDAWNSTKLAKTKPLVVDHDEDDDEDDFEDCMSYTTDATDSLSESECEGACFAFCNGLECEAQGCRTDELHVGTSNGSICSDSDNDDSNSETPIVDDDDGDDEDCLARTERLIRMASSCADFSVYLEDYLCQCGECPQYKLIAYEVQRYGTYANDAEKMSLTRILQAFSTYNEVVGYDCDMIPTAEECLQIWGGDENQAFKSFVTLYDEVPHLCA